MKRKRMILVWMVIVMTTAVYGCAKTAEDAAIPVQTLVPAVYEATVQPTPQAGTKPEAEATPVQTTCPDETTNAPEDTVSAAVSQTTEQSSPDSEQHETQPEPSIESMHETGTLCIQPGDTLALHIIPRLCSLFEMSTEEVKSALASCQDSKLIHDRLTDFRRMEGVIPPGSYTIDAYVRLEDCINDWILAAEDRYAKIMNNCSSTNTLSEWERCSLAAVVEWECLPNTNYAETAAVFLNRLAKGSKLQSCVTTEYALGFTRPYLTSKDIKIQSDYNTYVVSGVPVGPICVFDDACLSAAAAPSVDSGLFFFFNDYVLKSMMFFTDYESFRAEAAVSRERFEASFDIDPYGKLTDKKSVFGYAP